MYMLYVLKTKLSQKKGGEGGGQMEPAASLKCKFQSASIALQC